MNEALGLTVLSQIMNWSDERAREEFKWLRLMSRLKYDGYRDFQAGMRFIESLATWLQQFSKQERDTAYAFVRQTLVYIGPAEMQRLVEQFYPRIVRDLLSRTVATQMGIPTYRVLAENETRSCLDRLRRQTLFMGLSDGARIDVLRHVNVGLLTNEQLVGATQVDKDKWRDLVKSLREELGDSGASFRFVYLIDDFAGTGTSFLRYDEEKKKWKGKLIRFLESIEASRSTIGVDRILEENWSLGIHHYIATADAAREINSRLDQAQESQKMWPSEIHVTFGAELPRNIALDASPGRHSEFLQLTQTYYDSKIRTKHTDVGGVEHIGLGYGGCALPLVLEHNTPNNSVALLWAETEGGERDDGPAPAMRPLFRRRQRHS